MPDILIRGMDVPESCEECVIKHTFFRELKCADLPGMRNFGENRLYTDSRNPHCPLIELPPHGDLIDRDEYRMSLNKTLIYENDIGKDEGIKIGLQKAFSRLVDAPVIVPAEKGETQ